MPRHSANAAPEEMRSERCARGNAGQEKLRSILEVAIDSSRASIYKPSEVSSGGFFVAFFMGYFDDFFGSFFLWFVFSCLFR